ncbi:GNAT family N-acetyltransferase [Aliidongia dinghuensis]|nr:GNAT family N-acetyltransferase [Aliidongia dinghuensis]
MRPVQLIVTDDPAPGDREAIARGLVCYNTEAAGPSGSRLLAVLIQDETGATIGGLWGRTGYDWLYVELLHLPRQLRGTGVGRELMGYAEAEARARGCRGIWLDTFSFQARGFYEKLGFTLFGQIDDHPPGHQRFFLQKRL